MEKAKYQVVINDQLINYYTYGNGKQSVIFLHGWRSEAGVWNAMTTRLAEENKDLKIFALDMPGFGESPMPKKPFTVGDYADLTAGFITKLELENVILVGHSFGGRIAIKLTGTKPELVSKLVLVNSAGIKNQPDNKTLIIARLAKPLFKPKAMQGIRKKVYKWLGSEDYVATPELRETYLNIIGEDLTRYLRNINQPTLIIWGDEDKDDTPVEFAKIMNNGIANSKLTVLKDAGHFSFLDQPDEFFKELKIFLK